MLLLGRNHVKIYRCTIKLEYFRNICLKTVAEKRKFLDKECIWILKGKRNIYLTKMLNPKMLFGLNVKTKKNVWCISNDEILYPVGGVIVLHNFQRKYQRYIHIPSPENEISILTVSIKKQCLAIAERALNGEKPRIHLYNLENLKRITTLGIPFDINTQEFLSITFTHDSHHIAALTAGPDYFMYYFNWKKGKIESQAKANNPPSVPGPLTDMAINPKDATIVVFVGTSLFRLLSMSENVWRQYGFQKAQSFSILSVCWLTDDRVMAGCKDGKIIIVQSGDLNGVHDMNEVTEINIVVASESKKDQLKTLQRSLSKQMSTKQLQEIKQSSGIRCCTAIASGFFYSQRPGEVIYFLKTSKICYKKFKTFVIKKDVLCQGADYEYLYYVNCISTNPDGTLLLCTTNRSQIYWIPLQEYETEIVEFNVFEESLHHGPITGLSICLWKPIFMTCGDFDNSVRIWNHMTMKLVLNQTFMETVNCISLHPTGLYALIGFSDKLCFSLVLIHELQVYREFGVTDCQALAFSNNGHLFAAECNKDILVYSSITFNKIAHFEGHCQSITSLQWSTNDLILYSSSANGAIYEWSIEKNMRISDVVIRNVSIKGLIALKNQKIICIDSEGSLKEIVNAKVVSSKKLSHRNAECLDFITALENLKCQLLLAGKNGVIIVLSYPIEDEPQFNFFLIHNKRITKCCIVNNGQSFVSTDINGNICIWDITNSMSIKQSDNLFFEEILINAKELAEKNFNLKHLNCRMVEIVSEHSFEIKQKDDFYSKEIKRLEEQYTEEIKNLKKRIKILEKEHSMELNRIHLDITQMKQTHTSQMDQLDSSFNSKLLYEFQNYDKLRQEMKIMKESYEKKLEKIEKERHIEDEKFKLQNLFEKNNWQQQLAQLETILATEKEQSNDRIFNLQSQLIIETESLQNCYEARLLVESTKSADLKTELGIAKKKLNILQKEKEEFKSIKATSDNEYEILKQKYNDIIYQVNKLKKEYNDKENCIETEKKLQAETKRKIKEMLAIRAELECKLNALEMQLEECRNQFIAKEEELYKLQKNIQKEERGKAIFKMEIQHLKETLRSKDNVLRQNRNKIQGLKTRISNIQYDISTMKDLMQDPEKLKRRVKEIYAKHLDKRCIENQTLPKEKYGNK